MDSYWAVFLVFGLIVSGILVSGAFDWKYSYLTNVSDKYCNNYTSGGSCYTDNGTMPIDLWALITKSLSGWNLAVAGLITVGLAVGVLTGALNLLAIIPFALGFCIWSFLILPTGFLVNSGLPEPVPMILSMFFGLLSFIAVLAFIRTGQ